MPKNLKQKWYDEKNMEIIEVTLYYTKFWMITKRQLHMEMRIDNSIKRDKQLKNLLNENKQACFFLA